MSKLAPIVITLKRRNGRGQPAVEEELQPRNDEEEAVDDGSTRNGDVDADEGLGRGASRSQSRSPERRSPSSKRARTLTPSSVLNVSVLEQALGRFTGELDQWLQAEAGKVEFLEAKAAVSKEFLQQSGAEVGDFLRSHAPSGPDTSGTGFATSALPRFLEMVDEDRSALSEVSIALAAFAERRGFPLTEELKASGSTLPMLKDVLKLLSAGQSPGAGKKVEAKAPRKPVAKTKRRVLGEAGAPGAAKGAAKPTAPRGSPSPAAAEPKAVSEETKAVDEGEEGDSGSESYTGSSASGN